MKTIQEMVQKATGATGTLLTCSLVNIKEIERFAALVREDEREQIIALQQHEDVLAPIGHSAWGEAYQEGWAEGTAAYCEAIRARGQA